jgi:hypothetical protein
MKPQNWRQLLPLFLLLGITAILILPGAIGARNINEEASSPEDKIEPLVLEQLNSADETDFFIWMSEKADLTPAYQLETKAEKGEFVFNTLKETAERTQADVLAHLKQEGIAYKSFYIANKILVRGANAEVVMSLAARDDIARITANHQYQLQEPFIDPNVQVTPQVIESNIIFVKAPDVWALGYTGEGTVMAGNDTGLDWDHPAIINQYRGWNGSSADHNYNWWDATGTYPTVPGDGHGHGTHTTGTMVGDDGVGNQIGMAPGAQTVHCKNMTDGGSGDDSTFTECFEWDLAPWDLTGSNPDPDLAPSAINNSWGYWGGGAPQFEDEIAALRAAGIVVEVSAGNEGSGCSTLRSPGDYHQSLTTGSVQHSGGSLPGTITGFSSRGPSSLYPGEFMPDVMAPGENIRSSIPGGGFQGGWSGTSMSGPHVTALVALMWDASPGIAGDVELTEQIIMDTAVPLTGQSGSNCGGDYTTGPNNDWGFGTIDALAAVEEAILQGGPFGLEADPTSQAICAPADAVYDIEVMLNEPGYSDPVTLTAQGIPGGTSVNFSTNPVTPPGSSTMTIGNTGAATPGSYEIDVVGIAPTHTATVTVGLNLFDAAPGMPSLVSPADGAVNVDLTPNYEWTAVSQSDTYYLEVAEDSGFSTIVYTASVADTEHEGLTALEPLTTYYWRVTAMNPCGDSSPSSTFSFTTRDIPPILLVDDDNNSPDVLSYYTDALDALGAQYDVWDTNGSDDEPTEAELAPYEAVIWFTGVAYGGSAGPGASGEAALAGWLDDGGCMFISSQDYYYDRGLTAFMDEYLGVASAVSDVGQSMVTGTGTVFSGLGPYSLVYPFTNFSDLVYPDGPPAELAFSGNVGDAAVNKDSGVYRTTFWGFPFEAISTASDRQDAMQTVINWCGALGPTGVLAGTVTDADSSLGIEGATVTAEGAGTFSTQTDANGDYDITLPIGTYDVTASAENYAPETVTDIEIITDTTTIQDFALQGSSLTYSPPEIEEFMEIGDIVTNTVTVTNTGPLTIEYSVNIGDFGGPTVIVRPHAQPIVQPASNNEYIAGLYAPSIGAPPADGQAVAQSNAPIITVPFGNTAYSIEWSNSFYTAFDIDTPETLPNLNPYSPFSFPGAGDVVDGYAYVVDGTTLVQLDLATGAQLNTMPVTPPGGGQVYTGMAVDPTSGDVYLSSCDIFTSILFTLDVSDGTATQVGNISNSPCTIAIAIDGNGDMYGYDIVIDSLLSIDKNSGAGTVIGSLGFDANFGQGMGWDPATDQVYLAAFNNGTFQAELRIADLNTGNTTLVGVLGSSSPGGLTQLPWLGFEVGGGGPPWAYAVPEEGTIPPNSSSTFDVVFDAQSLYQTGDYTAVLEFSGTYVNVVPTMPLTMHLSCSTCGFLVGDITDYLTGDPVDASIHVTSTNGFDVTISGSSYSLAVQPGTYNFTVEADGYLSQTASVVAIQGETTETDFVLYPAISMLEYSPPSIEEDMEIGDVVTNTVTVTNTGFVDLEFSVNIGNYDGPNAAVRILPQPANTASFSEAAPVGPMSIRNAEAQSALSQQLKVPLAWSNGAPLPDGLVRYAHAQCDDAPDSFYVISGVANGSIVNTTLRYDAATDSWTQLASIPTGQEGPAAVCYQGSIYVAGGGGTNQFYIYDIATDSWSTGAALPRLVWGAAMGAYNGQVYLIGGDSDFFFGGTSNEVNIYDIATNTWTGTGATMPTAAVTAGSVQAGQYVYVVGGWGEASPGSNVDASQRYDMSSDTWETGPTFSSARADFALAVTSSNLYAIGGDADGGGPFDASSQVESLDHTAWPGGAWSDTGDPINPALTANNAGFCTNAVTGGEVWSVGGLDIGFTFHSINQYSTAEPCFSGGGIQWAYAVPDTGTVAAGETMTFSVVFDARSMYQVGQFTADLTFSGNFVNDVPTMPLTMNLTCPTCGFLVGDITDALTGDPVNATIHVTSTNGFDVTVTGESYSLAVQPATYNFTVEASGYLSETASVVATQGVTTETDFALIPAISILEYSPASIEEYMEIGDIVTNTVTVTNTGFVDLEFEVGISGYSGPLAVIPRTPERVNVACPADSFGYTCLDSDEPGGPAYDFEDISGSGTSLSLGDDQVSTAIPIGFAFDFYGTEYSELYVSSNGFLTVLPGQSSGCCSGQPIPTAGNPDGLIAGAWNDLLPPGGGSIHYETLGSGAAQYFVVQFTNIPHYGGGGSPVTFQFKLFEGSNNIEVHYMDAPSDGSDQAAGIENQDGTVGLQYYYGTGNTGQEIAVCYLYPGQAACGSGAEPWASAVPDSGTVPPGSSMTFDVVFDARSMYQVGTFTAELSFDGNFSNEPPTMPLTMHLSCPDCGILEGEITDDWTGDPLEADIHVTGPGGFDVMLSGDSYSLAVPAGDYDFTVSADGYFSETATVTAVAGSTTVTDFALVPIVALAETTPDSFEVTVPMGETHVESLEIANVGTIAFDFELSDTEVGRPEMPEIVLSVPASQDANSASEGAAVFGRSSTTIPAWSYQDVSRAPEGGINVLIVCADDNPCEPLASILLGYPDIGMVDSVDGRYTIPTLDDMLNYDVVVAWSNYSYLDSTLLGDVLADYVDEGGAVVLGAFNWVYTGGFGIGGRFLTEGYNPFVSDNIGNHYSTASLGTYDASHPIMEGVSAASDYYRDYVSLDPDATLVASWDDDEEFVATKGSVAAINSYTGTYYQWTDDVGMIFHNAVSYVASPAVDALWLTQDPISGTVEADSAVTIDIIFDTTDNTVVTQTGTYTAELRIDGSFENDIEPLIVVMHVVEQVHGLEMSGDMAASGEPGETVMYMMHITNTGNVEDTFNLTLGAHDWTTTLPDGSSVTLDPGASATVMVHVEIPADADDGEMDTVMLTATSTNDPGLSDSANLTTTAVVEETILYLPIIFKP